MRVLASICGDTMLQHVSQSREVRSQERRVKSGETMPQLHGAPSVGKLEGVWDTVEQRRKWYPCKKR